MKQNKNSLFYMGGSGLDQTDDLQKCCRSGLDRIQFYWIRTGLGLKNFHSPHISGVECLLSTNGVKELDCGVQCGRIYGIFGLGLVWILFPCPSNSDPDHPHE